MHRLRLDPSANLSAPLRALAEYERFHLVDLDYHQGRDRYPNFDERYFPQNCEPFRLPCFWISRRHVRVYACHPDCARDFASVFSCPVGEEILFPIHPSSLPQFLRTLNATGAQPADTDVEILAVPTSSPRTLLVWRADQPEQIGFLKTTLFHQRDVRLAEHKVAYCVGMTKLVEECRHMLPGQLNYLSESVGLVLKQQPDAGVLFRSIPKEVRSGELVVAPTLALYGGRGPYVPLMITLLERTDLSPIQFAEELLCQSMPNLWLQSGLRSGLLAELHSQNLLIALSPHLEPTGRFFYRDIEGLVADWSLRLANGCVDPDAMPYAWSWYRCYGAMRAGFPYNASPWWRFRMSLNALLTGLLGKLNQYMREWQRAGRIGGDLIQDDELTRLFSRHMMVAIEQAFNVKAPGIANIQGQMIAFIRFVMRLRHEYIVSHKSSVEHSMLPRETTKFTQ